MIRLEKIGEVGLAGARSTGNELVSGMWHRGWSRRNPSATIETATSIMATSRQRPVRDGTVDSTIGDGLLGPPTTAI